MTFVDIEGFENVSDGIFWAMVVVIGLIVVVSIFAGIIQIWLMIKYIVYNRTKNSANINGADAARQILDKHDLQKIRVSTFGSFLFGNSYSHYFKKVRLRRLTVKKTSLSSLAMGAQKSALAVLDKENDPDMKTRIILTPFIYFGPIMFIPIVLIGIIIDVIFFQMGGVVSLVCVGVGLALYVIGFILSLVVLKTETKAQARALELMREDGLATEEEIEKIKSLYKLYNIQYVNDLVLTFLEMILRVLQIIAKSQQSSASRN
ncbi:MAG: zinc metallopeptidase [Bacilli bacterium]|nr:zinc metallopeptidase [Bacilli bacterium]